MQGPGEEECRALLASEGDAARQLETNIAGDEVHMRLLSLYAVMLTCWRHRLRCMLTGCACAVC